MKFIIDAYGGDFSPDEIVKGVILASKKDLDLSFVLVGKENEIKEILNSQKADLNRFEIVNAEEVFTNNDQPTELIKGKENTSLSSSLVYLKEHSFCGEG